MKQIIILFLLLNFAAPQLTKAGENIPANSHLTLTRWMDMHCNLVRKAKNIPHVAYARHFAYTAIAAYESIVKNHSGYCTLQGQLTELNDLPSKPGKTFDPASLNAAYAAMMRNYYGAFGKASVDSFENALGNEFLKQKISKNILERSVSYGRAIADAIIQWSLKDGADLVKNYTPPVGESFWKPATTAATPFWYENRSITPQALSIFSLASPQYAADTMSSFYKMAKEVYDVTMNLSPKQKATALYWDDSPNGKYKTVFGHWTSILSGIIKQKQNSLAEASGAFCRMTIAMHDASLLAWKGKYQFHVLRPVNYIQKFISPGWTPLISTPPHPEFPAAHATLSQAAAAALCSVYGDSCSITDESYTDIGMPARNYSSIQQAAHEAGMSRLYGGIHYRYSIEKGFELGEKAARYMMQSIVFLNKK